MKKLIRFSLAVLILGAAVAPTAKGAGIMISDRNLWETTVGTWADVDETQIPTGYAAFNVGDLITLPSGTTVSFGSTLYGAQVPGDWLTWSGGNTPRVLAAYGDGSNPTAVSATASQAIWSFGLEMEPYQFLALTMTLSNGDILTQSVNGDGGATFFGWADMPVVAFTMSTEDPYGFVFGRMVEGPGAPPPGVPDGGSLAWATGLLWVGLFGWGSLRRRWWMPQGSRATASV
jgi:hypothetical protein